MTQTTHPLAQAMLQGVATHLANYAPPRTEDEPASRIVSGIRLMSYAKQGFLDAAGHDDNILLALIATGNHDDKDLYKFLRRAKASAFGRNDYAIIGFYGDRQGRKA